MDWLQYVAVLEVVTETYVSIPMNRCKWCQKCQQNFICFDITCASLSCMICHIY